MRSDRSARLMLLASMGIFGTIGLFRRSIPLGSSTLAMTRGFLGALCLLVVRKLQGKTFDRAAIRPRLPLLLLSGVCLGTNWILLFEAYNYTTVAIATLCYYMAPILVILASPLLFQERLTLRKILCVAAALLGMVFVSGVLQPTEGTAGTRGILFGLGAAILYATVVILNKKIDGIQADDRTVLQLGTAGVVLLPYVLLTEATDPALLTPVVILLVLITGFVHTGLAYTLYFHAIPFLPAQTAALYSYIDPIVAILLSAFLLAEPIRLLEGIGIVLVLGGTIASELPERSS